MSTSIRKKAKSAPERAYHHGNLRAALLTAALKLVETGKEEALSLRTVAALAGVSNGAPYRHFEDRQALLTALAAIGFERLHETFLKAKEVAGAGTVLAELVGAYLDFAARNEGLYRLMFTHNHLAIRFDEELATNAAGSFQELQSAVESQLVIAVKDARLIATALWATVHGVAMLTFERLITVDGPSNPADIRNLGVAAAQFIVNSVIKARTDPN